MGSIGLPGRDSGDGLSEDQTTAGPSVETKPEKLLGCFKCKYSLALVQDCK
jgi:hypothetical protein